MHDGFEGAAELEASGGTKNYTSQHSCVVSLHWRLTHIVMAVSTMLLRLFVDLGRFWSYLIGITVVTFIIYEYDKAIAGSTATRVPERVLHLLTVIGGTVDALLGQQLFRHKTLKKPFVLWFRCIVVLQALIVALIWCFT